MRAITPGDIRGFGRFDPPVRQLEPRNNAIGRLLEIDQFRAPLDSDASCPELIDQKVLVFVLRKNQDIGIRTDVFANVAKRGAGDPPTSDPQIHAGCRPAARDNGIGNSDLPVQLERSRLYGEGAGGCRRLSKPVNDSHARPEPCQPQRQHEARRSRSDDEDVGLGSHELALIFSQVWRATPRARESYY